MTAKIWNEISDCPNSGKFLIYILENNTIKKSELQKFTHNDFVNDTLDLLQRNDLVVLTVQTKPRKVTFVSLTDRGQQVALKYKAISDIENGLTPEPENNYGASKESVPMMKKV